MPLPVAGIGVAMLLPGGDVPDRRRACTGIVPAYVKPTSMRREALRRMASWQVSSVFFQCKIELSLVLMVTRLSSSNTLLVLSLSNVEGGALRYR